MKHALIGAIQTMIAQHYKNLQELFDAPDSSFQELRDRCYFDRSHPCEGGFQWLVDMLYQKYNKKVILLVDEYDGSLNHAIRVDQSYFKEATSFVTECLQDMKNNMFIVKAIFGSPRR